MGMVHVLSAQSTSWNGSQNNLWSNSANWSNGVPQPGYNVTIPWLPGSAHQPFIDVNTTIHSLNMNSNPNMLTAADGIEVNISGNLTVGYNAVMNPNGADIHIGGTLSVNGEFNLTTGSVEAGTVSITNGVNLNIHNGTLSIHNSTTTGGNIILNDGTIHFYDDFTFGGSGNIDVQTGTINIGTPSTSPSFSLGGNTMFNLNDGNLNVYGSSTFAGSGTFNVDNGEVNFFGSSTLTGGGDINSGSGSFYFGNDVTIDGGGNFNAENSDITVDGATWHTGGGGSFVPGTSTVTISGDSDITGNDMTFYDLNIEEGGNVSSSVNLTVNNNLSVHDESDLNLENGKNLNVIGEVTGDPQVFTDRPYIIHITINGDNSITAIFNEALTLSSAENASNYRIEDAGGNTIDYPANPVLGGSENHEVTLTTGFTILQDTQYYLIVNGVQNLNQEPVNSNHKKRFVHTTPPVFYSRQSGNWNEIVSWSTESHTGGAASRIPGQTGDQVIIGNSHTISLSHSLELPLFNSVTVNSTGQFSVEPSGHLITGEKAILGSGMFTLQPGAAISIGSPGGITQSGNSGNIRTGTRNYHSSANYIYNGTSAQITGSGLPETVNHLEIDNTSGVLLSESQRINGTLSLTNGTLIVDDGLSLIAPSKSIENGDLRYTLTINGEPGYRLLSSPLEATYSNFLSGVLTQGFANASLAGNHQPNVLWYDETYEGTDNQRWRAPSDAGDFIVPGRGFHVYMFGSVEDDERYNDPFPYSLDVTGQEHEGTSGTIDLNVTYTAEADTGWNLVGNPFGSAIDWDTASGWTKTNIDNTIYIWDPATNQYKTWNGTTGDLPDGKIAPFQGFWVKANGTSPELLIHQSAKSFGGEYVGKQEKQEVPLFSITAEYGPNHKSSAHFMFTGQASYHLDAFDAYKLLPPPDISDYLEIYSVSQDNQRLAINSLPRKFGKPVEIPVEINGYDDGENITGPIYIYLDRLEHIPPQWAITLINRENSEQIVLTEAQQNPVTAVSVGKDTQSKDKHKTAQRVTAKSSGGHSSFILIINPGLDASDLPSDFDLKQNYPNPFNQETIFRFELALKSRVRLEIFDILGRRVGVLVNEVMEAGVHEKTWDSSGLSSGVYISRLITPEGVLSKKLTLIN